jgi:hypothetical protein
MRLHLMQQPLDQRRVEAWEEADRPAGGRELDTGHNHCG